MQKYTFKPTGVCSREFNFEIENDVIKSVQIEGGCAGNLLGISKIIQGKNINEVIDAFKGVRCGTKTTSCPDQIALALTKYHSN